MTTPTPEIPDPTAIAPLTKTEEATTQEAERRQRTIVITAVIFLIVLIAGIVAAVIGLLQPNTPTDKIRDIFIIFMLLSVGLSAQRTIGTLINTPDAQDSYTFFSVTF